MQTETNSAPRHWYPHLHLLRAFAALSVLTYHVIQMLPWEKFTWEWPLLWFRIGWMGVDFFYVISGFVIMLSALSLYEEEPGTARKRFILRRIWRIVPLYLLTCVGFLLVDSSLFEKKDYIQHILFHLMMIHNWWVSTHGSIDAPNSTVAAEFQFYVLMMVLMPVFVRARMIPLLLSCVLAAWALRYAAFMLAEYLHWSDAKRTVYVMQMPMMLDLFGFGMLFAKWLHENPAHEKQPILLCVLFVAVAYLALRVYFLHSGDFWHQISYVTMWRTLSGISFMLLLTIFVLAPADWFQANPFYRLAYYLGEISYGIYLWHFPVITYLLKTSSLET